jgi:hypothetical protein
VDLVVVVVHLLQHLVLEIQHKVMMVVLVVQLYILTEELVVVELIPQVLIILQVMEVLE